MKHDTTTIAPTTQIPFSPPSIHGNAPLRKNWWFIGLILAILSMPVAGGFRWRLNTIHRQNTYPETQISEWTSKLREINKLPEKEVDQRKRAAEKIHRSEERFHVKACHGFERLFTKYSKV